jgi:hypothetical protein
MTKNNKPAKYGRSLYRVVGLAKDWLNRITSDEGCTSADVRHLRQFNHALADENSRLRF